METTETKKLKIGDVVFSKEHNCKVTVESDELHIHCIWFDEQNQLHRETINRENLTIISDQS